MKTLTQYLVGCISCKPKKLDKPITYTIENKHTQAQLQVIENQKNNQEILYYKGLCCDNEHIPLDIQHAASLSKKMGRIIAIRAVPSILHTLTLNSQSAKLISLYRSCQFQIYTMQDIELKNYVKLDWILLIRASKCSLTYLSDDIINKSQKTQLIALARTADNMINFLNIRVPCKFVKTVWNIKKIFSMSSDSKKLFCDSENEFCAKLKENFEIQLDPSRILAPEIDELLLERVALIISWNIFKLNELPSSFLKSCELISLLAACRCDVNCLYKLVPKLCLSLEVCEIIVSRICPYHFIMLSEDVICASPWITKIVVMRCSPDHLDKILLKEISESYLYRRIAAIRITNIDKLPPSKFDSSEIDEIIAVRQLNM